MARDGVTNIVIRLQEHGFDPRRVGSDAWEARCPAHRSLDHALAISRNEFDHVVLECRSNLNCTHTRIIGALGFTNDHLYAETPEWLITRLDRMQIQPTPLESASADRAGASEMIPCDQEDVVALPVASSESNASGESHVPPTSDYTTADSIVSSSAVDVMVVGAEVFDSTSSWQAPVMVEVSPTESAAATFDRMLTSTLAFVASRGSRVSETGGRAERPDVVGVLSELARAARLFRSADGRYCAQVPVGDRLEIFGLGSAAFRDWLIDGYLTRQNEAPSNWAIRRVIGTLEARARFCAGLPEVFVRVGQDDADDGGERGSSYFLDLGDATGQAVAIRGEGWSIAQRPGVHFRRPEGLLALPVPARDGSIELLRKYVNLTETDFRLMIAWLTAALRPVGPYPVLVLNGEQASGKSTLAKILRLLIDPQTCPSLALPNSTHDLMATAVNGWLMVYENITTIPGWLSDCVCQLAFGGGYASRALFTNDERSVIFAQRPVVLVGIDDFVKRGDLRDRSVFLNLAPISRTGRRSERSFWPAFQADYPRILGGVLDAIAGGLRELPSVHLNELPRMADYAEWGEAVSRSLGWGAETFLSTYDDNRKAAADPLLEGSTVAILLFALAKQRVNWSWSGSTQNLYEKVTTAAEGHLGPAWPKTFSLFGTELRRIAPQLRLHGIAINFERKRTGTIVTLSVENSRTVSPQPDNAAG
jgi:hypothetical protein